MKRIEKSVINPVVLATTGLLLLGSAFASSAHAQAVSYKDQTKLHDIAVAPNPENLRRDVQTLVDFGTRHTMSETESETYGIGAARRWIYDEFQRISAACGGCLEVYYSSDIIEGTPRIPNPVDVVSVVAIQRGKTDPGRYVLMSGDIDSRVTDVMDYTSESPGANDNASGVAGTLEAARILSQYEFNGSIVYAALAGEEQGLFGGEILARQALEEGWRLHAVLNNDMIGNIAGINGVIDNTTARVFAEGTRMNETEEDARRRRFTGGEVDSPSRNLARYISWMADRYIPNLDVMVVYRLDRFGRGGHHRPFNDVGFPGVRIMETNEHYDRQHQDLRNEDGRHFGDTIEYVDFDYAAKLTALNAVTLASMAWAPAPPSNVEIRGAVQPHTTLSWAPASEEDADNVAGYRIYWRYTDAPNWQFSRDVGNVTEFTLRNVVIDNYFFGVASVSKDGFESPVVFPGAAGTFDLR